MDDNLESSDMEHVLIIEDDVRLAELTRDYLEGNGFKVTVESKARAAWKKSWRCSRIW